MLRGPRKPPSLPSVQHDVESALADEATQLPAMPVLEREGPISRRLWSPAVDVPTVRLPKKRRLQTGRVLLCLVAIVLLAAAAVLAQQHLSAGRGTQAHMGSTTTTRGHVTQAYSLPKIPTATPQPSATATATLPPLPNFAAIPPFCNVDLLGNPLGTGTPTPAGCANCPYIYDQTQYPIVQVQTALQQAAALYQLPPILVEAISWEESGWTNTGVINCSYDTGLMGLKQGYWEWIDTISDSNCGLSYDTYDPLSLQGNADMGAKLLAFLYCYYGWRGGPGGSVSNPTQDTSDWYYQQMGLLWPDITVASGEPNPKSLCATPRTDQTVHQGSNYPGSWTFAQVFGALPASSPWSCPFSATAGDRTLYEIVVAAYQAGTGTIDSQGVVNQWYINDISDHLVTLSQGVTPT